MNNSSSSNKGDRVGDDDLTSRSTDELEKIKEDTAQIFVQFAHLHSHSSGAATLTNNRLCPDSPTDAARPPAPASLVRSKSREATRKDPHPKAVHSTKAQIVSSHHCVVDADAAKTTSKPRPDKLGLGPPKHRRAPSSSQSTTGSDSSEKTTPAAQDPPMLLSPEFSSSYPPVSTSALRDLREGLVRSAEHASARSTAAASTSDTYTASQERVRQCAHPNEGGDSVRARLIADRLKLIGDDLQDDLQSEDIRSMFNQLPAVVSDAVINTNTSFQAIVFMYMQSDLSWQKVATLFRFVCRVMEATRADAQFSFFEKAWHCLLDNVVPWIQNKGGWSAIQKETEPRPPSTPHVVRRSRLKSAQSEPVLPQSPTTTSPNFHQPCCGEGASNLSRTPVTGRMAYTPQMPRHHHHQHQVPLPRDQSSPCLPRDRSNSQHSHSESSSAHQRRSRVWSLTDSGSFKCQDDGVEDIEHSISELDMMQNHDEEEFETFAASQDDEEEEEEEGESQQQDAEQTLTASSLKPRFHASASFSNSTSPPIVVPSPHSGSQPETMSVEEFHIDSGIDTSSLELSLSCSPRDRSVSFSVGGVGHSKVHKLHQTSLTSLSSVASASPVHTSPSSRKNSSNGSGSSYFSNAMRGGSLKESSRPKRHNADSPVCHRTGSLTSRPSRRTTTPGTTNGTPGESTASGHTSWMGTPVRHMSTSASTIFELVKDYFRSP